MDLTFSLLNLVNFRFSHNLQCWMIYPRDITSTVLSFNYVHSYIIYYKPCKWWSVYHLSSWYLCVNQSYRWKCIVDRLLTITEQVIRGPQTCKYGGVKLAPEVISARLGPDMSTLPNPTHRESLVCVDPADIELISSGGIFTQVKIQIILNSTFPKWLINKVWSFCFLFIFFLFLFFLYCFYKNKQ